MQPTNNVKLTIRSVFADDPTKIVCHYTTTHTEMSEALLKEVFQKHCEFITKAELDDYWNDSVRVKIVSNTVGKIFESDTETKIKVKLILTNSSLPETNLHTNL